MKCCLHRKIPITVIKGLYGLIGPFLILTLASCSSFNEKPTGYSNANPLWASRYGFTDKRIDEDEYSIAVTGNKSTSKDRVDEIALLRAARLTQETGSTHFLIIMKDAKVLNVEEMGDLLSLWPGLVVAPVVTATHKEPTAVLLIRLLPLHISYPPNAFNAAEVIEHLDLRLR